MQTPMHQRTKHAQTHQAEEYQRGNTAISLGESNSENKPDGKSHVGTKEDRHNKVTALLLPKSGLLMGLVEQPLYGAKTQN
mmetsp:Transcript_4799/g.6078  ORF Transcript_4799/g.6078 Transcript_4799/m.6078 type:complete len:81 (-) Transcript_4799:292-534(-)|eukprot:CAMPEP_0204823834 /NCGR_PEP_ID=MMETSP1346-20131115/1907_1 /ASSEMBLY_ACC=CAM_ASM_000771 /TAXON_ID=215587 /ORGANISM="Aplanochytrium stocchinoi, Strain GSBS06" /LENGTH=80 /DNA_ID=CAMNT_0051950655 /DNA_START=781 /DNA_END=1023 /DNA_ORIENTATION=-